MLCLFFTHSHSKIRPTESRSLPQNILLIMVKAPSFSSRASGGSSFGDKFKPWRKGKSTKSKKGGSLKHQLRGLERLLAKTKDDDAERREQLTKSIQDLKQQIANKEVVEKERQNAKKSHGARFLDRQRLTRQWQLFEKQQRQSSTSASSNKELFRLGWDMLYVAHFPHAKMSYQSLFASNKKRAQPRGRALAKLVSARQAICKVLHDDETQFAKVAWVPDTVYEEMEIPKDWTTKLEKETYGYDESESTTEKSVEVSDDRFLPTSENTTAQSKVLEAAEAIEAELDRLEQEEDNNNNLDLDRASQSNTRKAQKGGEKSASPPSSDDDDEDSSRASPQDQPAKSEGGLAKRKRSGSDASSSSSSYGSVSDSSQEADPLEQQQKVPTKAVSQVRPKQKIEKDNDGESSWSSSSSSSDDDSSDDEEASTPKMKPQNKTEESSADSSTSSSSSSSHDEDDTAVRDAKRQKANHLKQEKEEDDEEEPMVQDDGFLIPADDSTNHKKAFANAKQHIPERLTGDKSQGWATQRQKPGQFKRRQQNGRRGF